MYQAGVTNKKPHPRVGKLKDFVGKESFSVYKLSRAKSPRYCLRVYMSAENPQHYHFYPSKVCIRFFAFIRRVRLGGFL